MPMEMDLCHRHSNLPRKVINKLITNGIQNRFRLKGFRNIDRPLPCKMYLQYHSCIQSQLQVAIVDKTIKVTHAEKKLSEGNVF